MLVADCAACLWGDHANHVEHWGKRSEGVIDGDFCYCKGDCAQRAKTTIDEWLSKWEDEGGNGNSKNG